jgi:uncharacterized protein YukE
MSSNVKTVSLANMSEPPTEYKYTAKTISTWAKGTEPGTVSSAASDLTGSSNSVSGVYTDVYTSIQTLAGKLHDLWSGGTDSVAAQQHLSQLYTAAKAMSDAADLAGKAVQHAAGNNLPTFKRDATSSAHSTSLAQSRLKTQNTEITNTWKAMPKELSAPLPLWTGSSSVKPLTPRGKTGTNGTTSGSTTPVVTPATLTSGTTGGTNLSGTHGAVATQPATTAGTTAGTTAPTTTPSHAATPADGPLAMPVGGVLSPGVTPGSTNRRGTATDEVTEETLGSGRSKDQAEEPTLSSGDPGSESEGVQTGSDEAIAGSAGVAATGAGGMFMPMMPGAGMGAPSSFTGSRFGKSMSEDPGMWESEDPWVPGVIGRPVEQVEEPRPKAPVVPEGDRGPDGGPDGGRGHEADRAPVQEEEKERKSGGLDVPGILHTILPDA